MTHTVTVAVTLQVQVPEAWGRDCTLGQIYDQANRAALHSVAHAIKASNLKAKIVGKPVATLTVIQEKKENI